MTSWICSVLQLREPRGPAWAEQQRELLQALDVDPEMIELLVAELQLCWEDGCLYVMQGAQAAAWRVTKQICVFCSNAFMVL